jgi:hypothetical protein
MCGDLTPDNPPASVRSALRMPPSRTGNTGAADRMRQLGLEIRTSEPKIARTQCDILRASQEFQTCVDCIRAGRFQSRIGQKTYAATREQTNARHGRHAKEFASIHH